MGAAAGAVLLPLLRPRAVLLQLLCSRCAAAGRLLRLLLGCCASARRLLRPAVPGWGGSSGGCGASGGSCCCGGGGEGLLSGVRPVESLIRLSSKKHVGSTGSH